MLMCASCWRRVPRNLRRAVYATFRDMRGQHGDRPEISGHARLARVRAYQDAREAAIEASEAAR
jgi:hypothetical protein